MNKTKTVPTKSDELRMEIEWLAWRLLIHDACRAEREGSPLCSEAQHVLDYFRHRGVWLNDLDENDELVLRLHDRLQGATEGASFSKDDALEGRPPN